MKQISAAHGIQGFMDAVFKISDKLDTIKREAKELGISISIFGNMNGPGQCHQVKFNTRCDMNLYQLAGTIKPEKLILFVCDDND